MSAAASEKVPLTVTWTPTSGVTSTVTVLGQVLNNGETNWVPTGKDNAIVLETSSADGEPSTVLGGQTYYITTGPALPDQATGVTVSGPASSSGSNGGGAGGSHGSTSSRPAVNGASSTTSKGQHSAPTSSPASSSSASSSPTGNSNAAGRQIEFTGGMGMMVAVLLMSSVLGLFAL